MGLDLRAIGVLRRTLAAYGGCRTYRDCGRVNVSPAGGRAAPHELFFTTDFVRPDRLRFDVGGLGPAADGRPLGVATVLWDGIHARAFRTDRPGEACMGDVSAALAWAARLDGPTCDYLLHLVFGGTFEHAEEARARHRGLEAVEGVPCHRIELPTRSGHAAYDLWIGARDGLLRALQERRDHRVDGAWGGGPPSSTRIEYHPALDVPVDGSVFQAGPGGARRLARFLEVS